MKNLLIPSARLLFILGVIAFLCPAAAFSDEASRQFVIEEAAPNFEDIQNEADFTVKLYTIDPETKSRKTTFEDGDLLGVKFSSPEEGKVWIFNLDVEGDIHLLFPNKWEKDNELKADKYYFIGTDAEYQWRGDFDESGIEYIFAVFATDEDDEFLDELADLLGEAFPLVSDDCSKFITETTRQFVVEEKPGEYGFGYKKVNVRD